MYVRKGRVSPLTPRLEPLRQRLTRSRVASTRGARRVVRGSRRRDRDLNRLNVARVARSFRASNPPTVAYRTSSASARRRHASLRVRGSEKRRDRDLNPGSQREHAFQACALPLGHPGSDSASPVRDLSPSLRPESGGEPVREPRSGAPDDHRDGDSGDEPHAEPREEVVPLDEHEEGERADEPPEETRLRSRRHGSLTPRRGRRR